MLGWLGTAACVRCGRPEEPDQLADRVVAVVRMAKRELLVDLISVATSVARLRQVAGFLQIVDDLSRSTFRDPDRGCDVSEPRVWVGGDALEHVRVVGYEPELVVSFSGT